MSYRNLLKINADSTIGEIYYCFALSVRYARQMHSLNNPGNNFDGLKFWHGFKELFGKSEWQTLVVVPTSQQLLSFAKDNEHLEDLPIIGETWHYLLQTFRLKGIMVDGQYRISFVKLMQYALNWGQFKEGYYLECMPSSEPILGDVISNTDELVTLGAVFANDLHIIEQLRDQFATFIE